jgi:hypothetical protein
MNTRIALLAVVVASTMVTGCIVPGPHGRPKLLLPPAPPRPPGVSLQDLKPYYVQGGHTDFYRDSSWYCSRERIGP